MSVCSYPGCDLKLDSRPYSRKGLVSVTEAINWGFGSKANSFAWAASEIAATYAVHEVERLWSHDSKECTLSHKILRDDGSPGLCATCRLIRYEFNRRWNTKAAKGEHIHHLAVSWANGESIDTDPAIDPHIDDLELFYKTYNPKWLWVERTIHYRAGPREYVGTFDAIVEIDCPLCGGRCVWLVDIKTGDKWEHEWVLQLAGYRYADYITRWEDTSLGHRQVWDTKMPTVAHVGVLWLDGDPDSPAWRRAPRPLVVLEVNQEAHNMFLRLVDLVAWDKRQAMAMKERDKVETVRKPRRTNKGAGGSAGQIPGDLEGEDSESRDKDRVGL